MKSLFIAILTLSSANALAACPNLAGNFLCKAFTNGKDQNVTLVQTAANNVTTYTMTIKVAGEPDSVRTYVADGKEYTLARAGYSKYTNQASCTATDLLVKVKGAPAKAGDLDHPEQDGLVTVNLKNGDLYNSYKGKWGNVTDKFIDETCARVK
jgi:hypothetical protein